MSHFRSILYKQIFIQLISKFFMIIREDSNKLYPSMVAYHQMILECSIIMHKMIHSFEIDTSWLLSLLKLLILFRWMKQFSKRLLKALTMWIKEEILVICKRLFKSRKKCDYFNYLINKHKMFHLFGLCLQRFVEKICSFHGQGRYAIKKHF